MQKPLRRLEQALVAPFFRGRPIAARRWWLRFDGVLTHSLTLFILAGIIGLLWMSRITAPDLFTGSLVVLPPAFGMVSLILAGLAFPALFGARLLESPRQWTLPLVFVCLTLGGYVVHAGTLPIVATPGHVIRTDELWKTPALLVLTYAVQSLFLNFSVRASSARKVQQEP